MVVSDSLGAPKGYEDSPRGWIWARGCMLRLLVSYFPAGFFSPSPLGCVLQNLPLQLLVARLSTWPPLNPCAGLCCDIQLRGLGGGGGQSLPRQGHCPLGHVVCLCVSSLTPLPPLSVLLFCCLNGADSLLLGGLLSSFQAFGFGVYCFVLFCFSPPALQKQTQWLAASLLPALRVCWGWLSSGLRFPLIPPSACRNPSKHGNEILPPGERGVKDATGIFWAGLCAPQPVGM